METPSPPWLKPYVPIPVLRAADVLADHVDFWEEEAFRVNGAWRERQLTDFIRRGGAADETQCVRFKQLLLEYTELSARHPPSKGERARQRALAVAVAEVKRWMRSVVD